MINDFLEPFHTIQYAVWLRNDSDWNTDITYYDVNGGWTHIGSFETRERAEEIARKYAEERNGKGDLNCTYLVAKHEHKRSFINVFHSED